MAWSSLRERTLADKVLTVLRSEKYKSKNYLFLVPFDLSQVPGYVEQVGQPLDMKTVADRIDTYDSPESFWKDVDLIFDKAIKYHAEKPTKWIAKFARDMKKAVVKERKLAESPKPAKKPKLPTATTAAVATPMSSTDTSMTSTANTKKSLKIKLNKAPKLKTDGDTPSPAPSSTEKAKPKLKIKLVSNKSSKSSDSGTKSAKETQSPQQTKATNKVNANPAGSSRGKELPQGVVVGAPKSSGTSSKAAGSSKSSTGKVSAAPKGSAAGKASTATAKSSTTGKVSTAGKASGAGKAAATGKATATTKSSSTTKKALTKRKPKPSQSMLSAGGGSGGGSMDPMTRRQCTKVLLGLRRRKNSNWFSSPVSDKAYPDYRKKIKHPMDLTTIQVSIRSWSTLALFNVQCTHRNSAVV